MRKLIAVLIAFTTFCQAFSQSRITLVVSGRGESIAEARAAAEKYAIEFCGEGASVTARKDIQASLKGAEASVTMRVSVNTPMDAKASFKLQRQNTADALENLYARLESLAPEILDSWVDFGPLDKGGRAGATCHWSSNSLTERFCTLLHNTLMALNLSDEDSYKASSLGLMVYSTDYFLNSVQFDMKNGDCSVKRNIRHYSKELFDGFTYEDDARNELNLLAPVDIKRLKRIFLIAVNSFRVTDQDGLVFRFNLQNDFVDVLFVDDFAKNITNIAFWDAPIPQKYQFADKWGEPRFNMGASVTAFNLPEGYPHEEVTARVVRCPASSAKPEAENVVCQNNYDPSDFSYYSVYPGQ